MHTPAYELNRVLYVDWDVETRKEGYVAGIAVVKFLSPFRLENFTIDIHGNQN